MAEFNQHVEITGTEEAKAALKDIGDTGAEAFTKIIEAAGKGDFTGLATAIGGRVAGSLTEAVEAGLEFVHAMSEMVEKTEALSQVFGTTIEETSGLREAFAEAGVSATTLDRVMQRMSASVSNNWAAIEKNIRESATNAAKAMESLESANLNLEKAQDKQADVGAQQAQRAVDQANSVEAAQLRLNEAKAKEAGGGKIDPALQQVFNIERDRLAVKQAQAALNKTIHEQEEQAAKDLIEQKEAALGVEKAQTAIAEAVEHQLDVQKKDIPTIVGLIKQVEQTGHDAAGGIKLADIAAHDLVKGIEAAANAGAKPTGFQTLIEVSKLFSSAAADTLSNADKLNIVMKTAGISARQMGGDMNKLVEVLNQGPEAFKRFTEESKTLGLALTDDDAKAAKAVVSAFSELGVHIDELKAKFTTLISPTVVEYLKNIDTILKAIPTALKLVSDGFSAVSKTVDSVIDKVPGLRTLLELLQKATNPLTAAKAAFDTVAKGAKALTDSQQANKGNSVTGETAASKEATKQFEEGHKTQEQAAAKQDEAAQKQKAAADIYDKVISAFNTGVEIFKEAAAGLKNNQAPSGTNNNSGQSVQQRLTNATGGWQGGMSVALGNVRSYAQGGYVPGYAGGGGIGPDDTSATVDFTGAVNQIANIIKEVVTAAVNAKGQLDANVERQSRSGHAEGGMIRGPGTGTSDSILARLSTGEFVMRAQAVAQYGQGFMHAVNRGLLMKPPGFAIGGGWDLPRFAGGGHVGGGGSTTPIHLHLGNETFETHAPSNVADRLQRYAVGQRTSATGRKPSWVT